MSAEVVVTARRPSPYATSARLDEVDAIVDGTPRHLVAKHLGEAGRLPVAHGAKPAWLVDADREPAVYDVLLGPRALGAECFGVRREGDGAELLLARVDGVPLGEVATDAGWGVAALELARVHRALAPAAHSPAAAEARLLHHDAGWHRRWLQRAWERHRNRRARRVLERTSDWLPVALDTVGRAPRTVVHGECFASNVLVAPDAQRAWIVDWETAAVGSGVEDLAALLVGLPASEAEELAVAYADALVDAPRASTRGVVLAALDAARLLVCLQWLGWSDGWRPPAECEHDWLVEADQAATRLAQRAAVLA